MSKLSKEVSQELKRQHERDWNNGPGWGAAISVPYKTRRYFSKEDSQKIIEQAAIIIKNWEKKLKKVPAKQRFLEWCRPFGDKLIPELTGGTEQHFADLGNDECRIEGVSVPYKVCGDLTEKSGRWAIYVLPFHLQLWGKWCVKVQSTEPAKLKLKLNCASRETWHWCDSEPYGFNDGVYWDKDREQFYCLYEIKAKSTPIPERERKRAWPRGKKHKEFKDACKALQEKLMSVGVIINGVKNAGSYEAYVDCIHPGDVTDAMITE